MFQVLWIPIISSIALIILIRYFFRSRIAVTVGLIAVLLSTTLTLLYVISDQFTGNGITEATIFHLTYGLSGLNLLHFPSELLFVGGCLLLVSTILAISFPRSSRRPWKWVSIPVEISVLTFALCFSVVVHPAVLEINHLVRNNWSPSAHPLNGELAGIDQPSRHSGVKRNLVYLYVESLERTFLDDSIFPSLANSLRNLEKTSISIRGIGQAPMTDWTIAGMVASQCGIPLATIKANRNDLGDVEHFVPGATCLGDILAWSGYHSVYIGGADLRFAGKQRFYPDHGVLETFGLQDFQDASGGLLPVSRWGIYDDTLFEKAFDKFKELSAEDPPFALFLLTLDTHPPHGHETPSCRNITYGDGEQPVLNAVECADRLVSEFVRKIEDYAEKQESDTELLVIVASDHLMMRNDISPILEANQMRRENLFLARSASLEPRVVRREATTLDLAPTVLSLLGWNVDAMALGRNLLRPEQTLTEKYGKESFFSMLQHWRMSLWKTWLPSEDLASQQGG